jgi:DNA-directed RNA polymerase subunit RPC12/RpoP
MKLSNAYLCLNCGEVTDASEVCQSCTSHVLFPLSRLVTQDWYSPVTITVTTPCDAAWLAIYCD